MDMSDWIHKSAIKVNDKISIKDESWHAWQGAIVKDVSDDCITVQLIHHEEGSDFLQNKPLSKFKIRDLDKMKIDCSPTVSYSNLSPLGIWCIPPYPVFYQDPMSNKKNILISMSMTDEESGIFSYEIATDSYKKLTDYPDKLKSNQHGVALDQVNGRLYIFCGHNQCFGMYDIKENQFYLDEKFKMPKIQYPESFYCQRNDSLYVHGFDKQFYILQYSQKQNLVTNIADCLPVENIQNTRMVFIKSSQQIMLFGAEKLPQIDSDDDKLKEGERSSEIWTYCIDDENGQESKWELYPTKMPKTSERFVFCPFDDIVFVFYCEQGDGEMWCLDLKTQHFFKSDLKYPKELHSCDIVYVGEGWIHVMNYEIIHVRINLFDVIPNSMYALYAQRNLSFVCAYIRLFGYDKLQVSDDLKHLISSYYFKT